MKTGMKVLLVFFKITHLRHLFRNDVNVDSNRLVCFSDY